MFTVPGQQPIRFRDIRFQTAPAGSFTFLSEIARRFEKRGLSLREHVMRFDYVVMHGRDESLERRVLPIDRLRMLARAGDFRLYETLKE
jgi:hypothetical protein